ncbi:uncharacterized protein LOC141802305 [Halichoeres trimaculatus]|uniref:uncharacterized protein LOC141802305 n=1 Tax=Halichoeres trimaculatus TaxID=147232 RepID=UPI003D9EF273
MELVMTMLVTPVDASADFQLMTRHVSLKPVKQVGCIPIKLLEISLLVELNIPVLSGEGNFIDSLQQNLSNLRLPLTLSRSVEVLDVNVTTVCTPDSNGDVKCQCTEPFAFPCDQCAIHGACSNSTGQTCTCISKPSVDGVFCEPITVPNFNHTSYNHSSSSNINNCFNHNSCSNYNNINHNSINHNSCSNYNDSINHNSCSSFNDSINHNSCSNYNNTSSKYYISSSYTRLEQELLEISLLVELNIPVLSEEGNFIDSLQQNLSNLRLPLTLSRSVEVLDVNVTTVCTPESNGDVKCQCTERFAFPCDQCATHGACSNSTGQTCTCISKPSVDGVFCEPITGSSQCLTSTTPGMTTTTTTATANTTSVFTTTMFPVTTAPAIYTLVTNTTSAPATPELLEISLLVELNIPVLSGEGNFIDSLQQNLSNLMLPLTLSRSVEVVDVNVTTVCTPDSNGDVKCQCTERFAFPCDQCATHGACSNSTGQTCTCLSKLPADGVFCEPITGSSQCLTSTTPGRITSLMFFPKLNSYNHSSSSNINNCFNHNRRSNYNSINYNDSSNYNNCFNHNRSSNYNTINHNTCSNYIAINHNRSSNYNDSINHNSCSNYNDNINHNSYSNYNNSINHNRGSNYNDSINHNSCSNYNHNINHNSVGSAEVWTHVTHSGPSGKGPATRRSPTGPNPRPGSRARLRRPSGQENFSYAIEREFSPSDNDETSQVYKDSIRTIRDQCMTHISGFISADIRRIRSGSTIVDYTVRATSFSNAELGAVKSGIFLDLSRNYTMIFDSDEVLKLDPLTVITGNEATVKCGPPPEELNLGTDLEAEWRLNDKLIAQDSQHEFTTENGASTLSINTFFSTDNGNYECRLRKKSGGQIFRQRTTVKKPFNLLERPVVRVIPVDIKVHCDSVKNVSLRCEVNSPHKARLINDSSGKLDDTNSSIQHQFSISKCEEKEETFTCQVVGFPESKQIRLELSIGNFDCNDSIYGTGQRGQTSTASCDSNEVGSRTAVCRETGRWIQERNNCILREVWDLLEQSQFLDSNSLPGFVESLSNVTQNFSAQVLNSTSNINAIVDILSNIANTSVTIDRFSMEDILTTVGILTTDGAKDTWVILNGDMGNASFSNRSESVSSRLLQSIETITSRLENKSFDIFTPFVLLNKTTDHSGFFSNDFNSSVEIEIPESGENVTITVITFASMDNVLPPRDGDNSSGLVINGRVVLVQSTITSDAFSNISLTFDVTNDTLGNPQCVFWNFTLFEGLGGWDDQGCEAVQGENGTVICTCNHLTSFSILMSPFAPDCQACSLITYIGVGISMASLVIVLIIEAVIWRKIRKNTTSYLRHVSIVNIAFSLLIADICFIVGASISEPKDNYPGCSAATFFIHFFYLALFFWMFSSALLLLYRTVSVFDGGLSKHAMLAIGFCLGYVAPLIIAVITIAVTAPSKEYIQEDVCWLQLFDSYAILAFVIPALLIVVINLIILVVVITKMLRRRAVGDAARAAERHVLLVIARSLAVLTPIFGLTWGLGIGTMVDRSEGIHIAFSFFNSLQGFFILVFGLLLDKKVRSEIAIKSQSSSSGTRSTSAGASSSGVFGLFRNWRRGRDGYQVSSGNSGASNP